MIDRFWRLVAEEGSTRPASLIRLLLPMVLWNRYSREWLLYLDLQPISVALGLSFFLSTSAMLVGWRSRLSTAWVAATLLLFFFYLGVAEGREDYTHHHNYMLLIAVCLLTLTPCGGSYSWDRWRAVQRAAKQGQPPPPEVGPTWGLRLIVLQLSMVYFWGGIAKCTSAYLSGDRFEHYTMYLYLGSDYPDWPGFPIVMMLLAWSSVLLEFALAVCVLLPRTLWLILPAGILFHAIIYYTLPVGPFSATMWVLYLACIPPDALHRFLDQLQGYPPAAIPPSPPPQS